MPLILASIKLLSNITGASPRLYLKNLDILVFFFSEAILYEINPNLIKPKIFLLGLCLMYASKLLENSRPLLFSSILILFLYKYMPSFRASFDKLQDWKKGARHAITKIIRMLTKADIVFIKSLKEKSSRHANKLFVAEGNKLVNELLQSKIMVERILAIENWVSTNGKLVGKNIELSVVSQKELDQLSNLKSTREVLAICKIPEPVLDLSKLRGLTLVLDTIQDPGNLGTIIRVADWYGLKNILCSHQTADCFNSKVVQASMGSISRVQVFYGDLSKWLKEIRQPVLAASMEGENVHHFTFPQDCLLIIGNEGAGISTELKEFISQTLSIPKHGNAESLNAAVAAAIMMDRYLN